jgi:transcription antitermination factor NusG
VAQLIDGKGFEVYCPLTIVRKKWSDRVKKVEEPLFKSYVFVCITEAEKTSIRFIEGVVNFIYWLGKPAVIKKEEIEIIRKFLNEYEEVQARPIQLKEGTKVRIRTGLLMNHEGYVVKESNKRAHVVLETLGYELTAQFEKKNLEPIRQ